MTGDGFTLSGKITGKGRGNQRRRDAVFVWSALRVNAVTQRLFVTKDQVRNLADPLETGEGLAVVKSKALRNF